MDNTEKVWKKFHGLRLETGHVIELAKYSDNGRPALTAYLDDEAWCRITVNLPEAKLGEYEFHVKHETRNMCGEFFDAIIGANIATPTGIHISAGFVEKYAEVWTLTKWFIDHG